MYSGSSTPAPLCGGVAFPWQLENGSFMSQDICSLLLTEVKRREYTYHYEMCFIKSRVNGRSLTPSVAFLCRCQCSPLVATAASASLNFTLNQPALWLLYAGAGGGEPDSGLMMAQGPILFPPYPFLSQKKGSIFNIWRRLA